MNCILLFIWELFFSCVKSLEDETAHIPCKWDGWWASISSSYTEVNLMKPSMGVLAVSMDVTLSHLLISVNPKVCLCWVPQSPRDILATITSVHSSSLKLWVVRSCSVLKFGGEAWQEMVDEFSLTALMVIIKISPLHRALFHPLIWLHFDSAFRVEERWVRSYFIYIGLDQIMIQMALPFSP